MFATSAHVMFRLGGNHDGSQFGSPQPEDPEMGARVTYCRSAKFRRDRHGDWFCCSAEIMAGCSNRLEYSKPFEGGLE